MNKRKVLCLILALCALTLTACQQKEVFDTNLPPASQPTAEVTEEPAQDLFGSAVVGPTDYDDGSYDPASEEGGDWEEVPENPDSAPTSAPVIQSEYAGATPVLIDPIDKPTPTPLPTLSLSYVTYEASSLHMTFDGPSGWTVDDSKSELTKEVKGMLDTLGGSGELSGFSPSNTAERAFLGATGIYANYTATEKATGAEVAGRMIVTCVNRTLYSLHVAYPRGYRDFYVTNVYDKFRHTVKLN